LPPLSRFGFETVGEYMIIFQNSIDKNNFNIVYITVVAPATVAPATNFFADQNRSIGITFIVNGR
jgi:hypothetical protein